MNQRQKTVNIRRILLALDPSYRSLGALETAAELAGSLGAELTAIFVEDANLLQLAGMPAAIEVGSLSCCLRPLRLEEVEMQLRAQADEMRKALQTAAGNLGVEWSFRVTRGAVSSEILLASMEADLVILGKRGWTLSRRLGSTVQVMISRGKGMALVLQQGAKLKVPVVAICNETESAPKILETAAVLARVKKGSLMVLAAGRDEGMAREIQTHAKEYMEENGVEGGVVGLVKPTIADLAQAVRGMGPVVLPCEYSFLCHEDLCELVNVIENPVLLIR